MENDLIWEAGKCKLVYNPNTGLLSKNNKFKIEEGTLYTNLGIPAKNILYYSLNYYKGYHLCVYLIGSRKNERNLISALYLTEEQALSLITFMDIVLSPNTTGAMKL